MCCFRIIWGRGVERGAEPSWGASWRRLGKRNHPPVQVFVIVGISLKSRFFLLDHPQVDFESLGCFLETPLSRFDPALSQKTSTLYWIRSNRRNHDTAAIGETAFDQDYRSVQHILRTSGPNFRRPHDWMCAGGRWCAWCPNHFLPSFTALLIEAGHETSEQNISQELFEGPLTSTCSGEITAHLIFSKCDGNLWEKEGTSRKGWPLPQLINRQADFSPMSLRDWYQLSRCLPSETIWYPPSQATLHY